MSEIDTAAIRAGIRQPCPDHWSGPRTTLELCDALDEVRAERDRYRNLNAEMLCGSWCISNHCADYKHELKSRIAEALAGLCPTLACNCCDDARYALEEEGADDDA